MLPREGKGQSIPLPVCVWTNRPQDWPVKGRYEWKSITRTPWSAACWTVTNPGQNEGQSCPHSMTYNLLDEEKNPGHSSSMTGGNSGRRKKPNDWPDPLAPKWYLFVRGNLEKNLQFEDRSRCGKICWIIAKTPGGPLAHKKNL